MMTPKNEGAKTRDRIRFCNELAREDSPSDIRRQGFGEEKEFAQATVAPGPEAI
jgi:hypothetical protein